MKTVDAKGLLCPQPLIMAKRAMKEMDDLEEMIVLCDNPTSLKNLMTFLQDQDARPESRTLADGVFEIKAVKPHAFNKEVDEVAYCTSAPATDYVVVLKSNLMGDGDPALGEILMKAFVNALHEQEKLPTHIILYNSGVKLAGRDSDVLDALINLEDEGIRVIVCGTCIDFYGMKDLVGVGMISNMYTITETMANAGHILSV